jgi:hypothetical protein
VSKYVSISFNGNKVKRLHGLARRCLLPCHLAPANVLGVLQGKLVFDGGSHANVDLVAAFANCDYCTLPAMWFDHEDQAN